MNAITLLLLSKFFVITGILFITIIIHELGHYIWIRLCGIKPRVVLKWWAIMIATDGEVLSLPLWKAFISYASGPVLGAIFLATAILIWPNTLLVKDIIFMWVVYAFMCMIDACNMIDCMMKPINAWLSPKPMIDVHIQNLQKIREKLVEKKLI